jgi:hypothetical protein
LLRVCVGSATADVMGMLREIVGTMGMVREGRALDRVSGSSDGSSWGYGDATASAARALNRMARRIVGVVVVTTRDDDFVMRLASLNVRTDAVVLFSICLIPYPRAAWNLYICIRLQKSILQIRPSSSRTSPGGLLGSTIAVFKLWYPSSICYCDAALVCPASYV